MVSELLTQYWDGFLESIYLLFTKPQSYVKGFVFNLVSDIIILLNVVLVGLQVDYTTEMTDLFNMLQYVFVIHYLVEVSIRFLALAYEFSNFRREKSGSGKAIRATISLKDYMKFMFANKYELVDTALCTCTFIGVIAIGTEDTTGRRMWRCAVLRLHRYCRVMTLAKTWAPLSDLWLVLMGLVNASKALVWFGILLFLTLYTFGACFTGLVTDEDTALDAHEYFGSVFRSSITLLQLATLDSWASSIIRPLFQTNWITAVLLMLFVVATSYGLLSIAVGVLVWSTCELARTHQDHRTHKSVNEDMELIKVLKGFFEATLMMEEKSKIDLQEMMDAMVMPQVARAFKSLDLPVADVKDLFQHLDKNKADGITPDEFEKGILALKSPASRFDVACLTANIGGSVGFVARLEERTDELVDELGAVTRLVGKARDALKKLAEDPDSGMGNEPEVILRKAGKIKMGPPPKKVRYTEGGSKGPLDR